MVQSSDDENSMNQALTLSAHVAKWVAGGKGILTKETKRKLEEEKKRE
jgi:hypothetical protein